MAAITICSDFGAPQSKVWHCFHCFHICFPWGDGTRYAMILVFWMLSFKPTLSLSSFTFIKRLFSSSSLSAIGWCHLRIWGYWYFSQHSRLCSAAVLTFGEKNPCISRPMWFNSICSSVNSISFARFTKVRNNIRRNNLNRLLSNLYIFS